MEPILKWAGGKRQLLKRIKDYIEIDELRANGTYYEPFIGGGSLCFSMELPRCVINDYNSELINTYEVIRDEPQALINRLKSYAKNHSKEFYYEIRALDRDPNYTRKSKIIRAARFIYLNRTCYNGLYRENKNGYFNVPMGRYSNPEIAMVDRILALSNYFRDNNIQITCGDFADSVNGAVAGDLVYFDPPYDYDSSGFTTYTGNGFSRKDLERLKEVADALIDRGVKVIISNNDTKFVNNLFRDNRYIIEHIEANRFISCDGKERKKAMEVIIHG